MSWHTSMDEGKTCRVMVCVGLWKCHGLARPSALRSSSAQERVIKLGICRWLERNKSEASAGPESGSQGKERKWCVKSIIFMHGVALTSMLACCVRLELVRFLSAEGLESILAASARSWKTLAASVLRHIDWGTV